LFFIQQNQLRGAEVFASQLADHLAARGHSVKLIALESGQDDGQLMFPVLSLGINTKNKWYDIAGWRKVANEVTRFQPDIVQANAGDTLVYVSMSKMLFRWKTPVIYRNASMIQSYSKSWASKWIYARLLNSTDAIAAVADETAQDLWGLSTELKEKTTVIPIGVTVDSTVKAPSKAGNGSFHLLHVGGFTFEKNHKSLLRIFNEFLKVYPGAVLHLVGEGPLKKEIESLSVDYSFGESVRFYGSVHHPLNSFSFVDALLLPSIIEGTPAVILEAFATGIPVVAYNVGGISHFIQNEVTGFLVALNNEEAFVEAMLACVSSNNTHVVKNARQLVAGAYNNEKIAADFERLYNCLKQS
jgi:L-malate glycosyltransferase